MSKAKAVGLGEPETLGKKSLFQPPTNEHEARELPSDPHPVSGEPRMRMALEVTKQSLAIMQEHQSRYRLEKGHLLPKWKIISEALVLYDKHKKGEGSEKQPPSSD